ncbi:MAG: helix-turn-helix transcriptional regulator [bacterium]|nr:helix-turn-helix transcriptional regulator [bacterium]
MLEEAQALDEAAKETLKRIDADREKVPSEIRRLLLHIRKHLFTEGFGVAELKRAFGEAGQELMDEFRIAVGEPPSKYISGARLEIASRLLRDSSLSVGMIGLLVGYSNIRTFSAAFKRWSGKPPREYRDHSRLVEETTEWSDDEFLSSRFLDRRFGREKSEASQSEASQAERLSALFRKLYPDTDD